MNKQKGFTLVEGLLIVLVIVIVGAGGWYVMSRNDDSESSTKGLINSYGECVDAGGIIAESFPEQCMHEGQGWTRELSEEEKEKQTPPETDDKEETAITEKVKHFNIDLPGGWSQVEGAEKSTGLPEFYYEYSDGSGKTLGISINSLGFGGGGDGYTTMSIEGGRILLDDTYTECQLGGELDICESHKGDGKLVLLASTADKHNGDDYIIWFNDNNSESQEAYKFLADIAETIELL